jgi:glycopeptide antibiotics resistance protein
MLPMIWNKFKEFKYCFLLGVSISLLIETMQFIENIFGIGMGRVSDIDDLFLNSIGVVIGCFIYRYIVSRFYLIYRKQVL